ncbi:MAG: response regulator, partial [Candidatus Dadabacteria bacterium]|nr:response regulator [Candidatus Dadabacteria bacterium]
AMLMKILVVDDDPAIREYLKETLELTGQTVIAVSSGYDAIDYVRDHGVDLAYIDVVMPGIDGYETLKKMRDIDPKISAVILSGNAVERLSESTLKKGVYASITKPVTIEQIEEINKAYEMVKGPIEFIYDNPHGLDTERLKASTILIADDEEEIIKIVTECLKGEGFTHLETARDGQDAITRFNKVRHDLVVVDIMMPRISGIEVLRHVKAISPESEVIIITGNADKSSAITAVRLGAYDYIEKPFDLDSLARIVTRAVERRMLIGSRGESE